MATPNVNARQWLSVDDLATRELVSVETVRYWRQTGVGPRGYRLGRHVRFDLADVIAWEESRADPEHGRVPA